MSVAWPNERKICFYGSSDLKSWTHLSDFGPAGSVSGIWECPDLLPLKVEGGGERWLLIVNVGSGAPAGGSGGQYFTGEFDGTRFVPDDAAASPRWLDYGPDFYAGVPWSGGPPGDDRRLLLGWMSNWEYANDVPTQPWRSAMSVPRQLTLRRNGGVLQLVQIPVEELSGVTGAGKVFSGGSVAEANAWLARESITGPQLDLNVTLQSDATGLTGLEVFADNEHRVLIQSDTKQNVLILDRTKSGLTDFHSSFPRRISVPLPASSTSDTSVTLRVLLDACFVEVFADDGAVAATFLAFPAPEAIGIRITAAVSVAKAQAATITFKH